jgi:hypothetical protein
LASGDGSGYAGQPCALRCATWRARVLVLATMEGHPVVVEARNRVGTSITSTTRSASLAPALQLAKRLWLAQRDRRPLFTAVCVPRGGAAIPT